MDREFLLVGCDVCKQKVDLSEAIYRWYKLGGELKLYVYCCERHMHFHEACSCITFYNSPLIPRHHNEMKTPPLVRRRSV